MTSHTEKQDISGLQSVHQITIAERLGNMLLASIATAESELSGALMTLKNQMWKSPGNGRVSQDNQEALTRALTESKTPEQIVKLAEAYAHLGHLFEIAGQGARSNFFEAQKQTPRGVPGGVSELLDDKGNTSAFADAKSAVNAFNKPVLEPVFTMHPTNVNQLGYIKAQRNVAAKLEAARKGEKDSIPQLKEAIAQMASTSILPERDGKDANFTTRDELDHCIYFLKNVYEDLPKTYAEFDEALSKKFGSSYEAEKENLHLNLNLNSWGSAGDKDGNSNIKSENTLEAIAVHKQTIIDLYRKDIAELSKNAGQEVLNEWGGKLSAASDALKAQIDILEEYRLRDPKGNDIALSPDEFNQISKAVAEATPDISVFKADIKEALAHTDDKKTKAGLLDLSRKASTFGFQLAKVEYRETAEEYARVIDKLVPPERIQQILHLQAPTRYSELTIDDKNGDKLPDDKRRTEVLTALLDKSELAAEIVGYAKAFMATADEKKFRKYDKKDATAITYHSLKRMELARDHPEMIATNVLAECQGTSNMLEAQFLQVASGKDGKRAILNVAPLFEEPDTMKNAHKIVGDAYDNPAYQQQLTLTADKHNNGNITQEVWIAHSDNARRSGVTAARGFIHAAHPNVREETKKHKIGGKDIIVHFSEGGSQSDAYRNGVRAITSMVNAFSIHDFTKTTFQGGDLLNYFNNPDSTTRLLIRHFTHAAKVLSGAVDKEKNPNKRIEGLEKLVTKALTDTLEDYELHHFNHKTNPIGYLFADKAVNYDRQKFAGNVSTRAGERNAPADKKEEIEDKHPPGYSTPVSTHDMRTIAFSETFQHGANIVPSWLGVEALGHTLQSDAREAYRDPKKRGDYGDLFIISKGYFDEKKGIITPEGYKYLYDQSPAYRDVIDKCAYGLVLSDMKTLSERVVKRDDADSMAKEYARKLMEYYTDAAKLVQISLTGEKARSAPSPTQELDKQCDEWKQRLQEIPQLASTAKNLEPKLQYLEMGSILRNAVEKLDNPHADRLMTSAKRTVYHGRTLAADDISYGKALEQYERKNMRQVA